nr:MAG TPA: hypothetical protein [Bacteriophage sp.]
MILVRKSVTIYLPDKLYKAWLVLISELCI